MSTTTMDSPANTEHALQTGDLAPDFALPELRGKTIRLSEKLKRGPVNLVFYRGGWCPICQSYITRLTLRYADFESMGASIIAVSNEDVEKGARLLEDAGPPFPLVIDKESQVIDEWGARVGRRDVLGWIKRKHDYAMPSWFVIQPDRTISWVHRGKGPRDRADIDEVLDHLRGGG